MAKPQQFSLVSIASIFFAIVGLALVIFAISQSTEFRQRASEGAVLYLTSNPTSAVAGQQVTVSLDVETSTIPIQTATVVLTYPEEKLTFEKMDTSKSPFDMSVENIHQSGYITLSRDASYPVNGKSHIATIHFTAKAPVNLTSLQPVSGTAIINTNNQNIYTNAVSREETTTQPSSIFSIQFFFQFFRTLLGIS